MRNIFTTVIILAVSASGAYAADVKAGQAAYGKACKSCHGADGTANPADRQNDESRNARLAIAREVQALSEADIKKVIVQGQGKMKPTTSAAAAADDIAAYVKTLKK